jgi:hypothetical protein
MRGEIRRSEGPKWFPDIPKYTEDSRKTGFQEQVRCLGSEFGEQVLTVGRDVLPSQYVGEGPQ